MTSALDFQQNNGGKWNHLLVIAAIVIVYVMGLATGINSMKKNVDVVVRQDTTRVVVFDTLYLFDFIPKDSVVLRYEYVKIPVTDSIRILDTVRVELPIEQKVYEEPNYAAWVSGYKPSLDSIRIFQQTLTNTVTITERIVPKEKKWGFGVSVGGTYYDKSLQPYIGIGINYNILNW